MAAVLVAACTVSASNSPELSVPATPPSSMGLSTPLPSDSLAPAAPARSLPLDGDISWTRVAAPFGEPNLGERIDGLVTWPSGLMAYGRVKVPGRNQFDDLAAVFLSDTGETWRTVPIDPGVGPADTSEISLLVAGPRGIVLFGDTCCAVEEPAAWWSADGETWERIPVPSTSADGPQLWAGTATADGFVVVGSEAGRAGIWTSADGRVWTAVTGDAARLGPGTVADVELIDGRWLAAGTKDVDGYHAGALWESSDGITWRPEPADGQFKPELDTVFWRLFAAPEGVLLIGNEGAHDERVQCEQSNLDCGWGVETHWWSRDGRTWERLPPVYPQPGQPAFEEPGPNEFRLLAVASTGLIDLGEDRSGVVRLWLSSDGRDWLDRGAMDIRSTDLPSGLAVLDGRIVAVGDAWDGGSKPGEPAVWIGSGL